MENDWNWTIEVLNNTSVSSDYGLWWWIDFVSEETVVFCNEEWSGVSLLVRRSYNEHNTFVSATARLQPSGGVHDIKTSGCLMPGDRNLKFPPLKLNKFEELLQSVIYGCHNIVIHACQSMRCQAFYPATKRFGCGLFRISWNVLLCRNRGGMPRHWCHLCCYITWLSGPPSRVYCFHVYVLKSVLFGEY
jgi:hypothetical protein